MVLLAVYKYTNWPKPTLVPSIYLVVFLFVFCLFVGVLFVCLLFVVRLFVGVLFFGVSVWLKATHLHGLTDSVKLRGLNAQCT